MAESMANMRREYTLDELDVSSVSANPFDQFRRWFDDATKTPALEPNAMVIATVDANGVPSQRTVLLKKIDDDGFVFFTNYDSQKCVDIRHNHAVSLLFYWPQLERQVRIVGQASNTSAAVSDSYFSSRPRDSQIAAAASPQSQVVPDREWLAQRFERYARRVGSGGSLERPDNWGGILVTPYEFEFWQGRPNRLHDRLRYRLQRETWTIDRLAP